MSKKCTPLWREAHVEVKSGKNWRSRSTFWSSDVEKVHDVVALSTCRSKNEKTHHIRTTFGLHDTTTTTTATATTSTTNTLHYTTLNYITLHYTTLHYTTLHYTTPQLQLQLQLQWHYITLHYATLHYITLHYTTLHYIHYTTLHYPTPHCTTLLLQVHLQLQIQMQIY